MSARIIIPLLLLATLPALLLATGCASPRDNITASHDRPEVRIHTGMMPADIKRLLGKPAVVSKGKSGETWTYTHLDILFSNFHPHNEWYVGSSTGEKFHMVIFHFGKDRKLSRVAWRAASLGAAVTEMQHGS